MDSNKKTNLLIFSLIIIIVLLATLLVIVVKKNKDSKEDNTPKTTVKSENGEKRELITTDASENTYYVVYLNTDEERTLKIISTTDGINFRHVVDLSNNLDSGYENVPYDGYKIEGDTLYYITNDCDSRIFKQGDELKLTLNDNAYTLKKSGKTYKANAGVKC